MNWFSNLRTMTKLGLSFGLLIVMIITVGVLGLSTGATANAAADRTFDTDLPGMLAIAELDNAVVGVGRAYKQALIVNDARAREEALHEIDRLDGIIRTQSEIVERSLLLEVNKARLIEVKAEITEFVRSAREGVRISETNMGKAVEMTVKMGAASEKLDGQMEAMLSTKVALGRKMHDESGAQYGHSRILVISALALALLLGVAAAFAVGHSIATPLHQAVAVLERVAEGDLTARLAIDRTDEVGALATSLNKTLDAVAQTLTGVRDVSVEVSEASSQLAATAQQISTGAQEQAASLEETAASLEEISSTVKQNSDNAQAASQLASGARDTAERGGKVVESAVSAMSEITKSSKKIADIITTIDEIAFQTNLLALNAAVEAARAGEQGRGFGVVAAEVRSLAQRTAMAAKEIRGLIAESSSRVEAGTMQVNESGKTLEEIVRAVKRVTDMVADIAAASREQNTGVDQVNTAVTQVDQVTQLNASQTEELSATATDLSDKSRQLQELVAAFDLGQPAAPAARQTAKPLLKAVTTTARRAGPPPLPRASHKLNGRNGPATPPAFLKAANGYEEF